MKITDVKLTALRYNMDHVISSANDDQYNQRRFCLIVEVFTDEGIVGIGESDHAGGPIESTMAVMQHEIIPLVIGRNPFEVERIWQDLYSARMQHGRRGILMHAMSGIDIACWDIIGKVSGLPLYKILGAYRDSVPAYASGGCYQGYVEEDRTGMKGLLEELHESLDHGFLAYKMKIGKQKMSIPDDMKRVAAVREVLGPDKPLMVDANCTWDYVRAVKTIPYLEELDVKFIEEPTPVDHYDTCAKIAASTWIPIAASENETSLWGFKDLILKGDVYYLQPNACRVGGITNIRKIAAMAEAYERRICTHSWSTAICMTANLHILASTPIGESLEYDVNPNPFREELNIHPFELKDGNVVMPDRPGLGIELNMDTVERYRMK